MTGKLGRAWVGAWVVYGTVHGSVHGGWGEFVNDVLYYLVMRLVGGGEEGGGLVRLDLIIGGVLVWC